MKFKILILFGLCCFSFVKYETRKMDERSIPIEWVDQLNKDFSFKNKWSYPEGVFRNKFGQLSCDSGICIGIDGMMDNKGKILKDSIDSFYRVVDTTHLKHSLKSSTKMYEWNGTNFMSFKILSDNSILGQSSCNVATHSSLCISIKNDSVSAWVDFKSITSIGRHKFPLNDGSIKIDKGHFENGIVKAEFDFTFINTLNQDKILEWKGLIFSDINNK